MEEKTYSIPIHENGIKTSWTIDGIVGDEKYLQLLKDNVTEFSLSDFYEIFKVSLCAREVQFCTNQKQFLSTFHKCYVFS